MSSAGLASTHRPRLVLGSASPRRRDLLSVVGLDYVVVKPEVDEVLRPGEAPKDYVLRNARAKGDWTAARVTERADQYPNGAIVISADTIVVLGDDVLEKPRDPADAAAMLARLSGRAHKVLTGVFLTSVLTKAARSEVLVAVTEVLMKPLSSAEIAAYVASGEPLDKAGAYAAQGIGSYMVRSIHGSYANVVGLPIAEVVERLEAVFGYSLWNT